VRLTPSPVQREDYLRYVASQLWDSPNSAELAIEADAVEDLLARAAQQLIGETGFEIAEIAPCSAFP